MPVSGSTSMGASYIRRLPSRPCWVWATRSSRSLRIRRQDEPIKQILESFPNIDASGITSSADQGDVVNLRYIDQNRRVERQTSFMNPILPADLDKVLDADMFVCVPITDYEVGQPTLRHIKENSRATVVLDAHGPATTLTRSGERQGQECGLTRTYGFRTSTS